MAGSKTGVRPWPAAVFSTVAIVALLAIFAAPGFAATGGAPSPGGAPPPPGSPVGAPPAGVPSAGELSVASATATPRKSFYYGFRNPTVRFTIASTELQNDLRIDVVDSLGQIVRTFYRNDVVPGAETLIRWDGVTSEGRPAANGRYSFLIGSQAIPVLSRRATRSSVPTPLSFDFYRYAFPVLGSHDYGDSGARFGAGRSGHTHEGQDVMAECGVPLVAARGGRVQIAGIHSAAGNYVVIDGKGTTFDFMYAHLAEPSPLQTGDAVRTGQPIGIVGETGSATACHLHFEMWSSPGWYEGGSPVDPLGYLKKWDAYS